MERKTHIYVLIDPITIKVRYIGITAQTAYDRLLGHIHSARYRESENYHKACWIKKVLNTGLKPIIKIIKTCDTREEAEQLEEILINKYQEKHNLVNIALDSSKFDTTSAAKYLSKKVFVYDYQGNFIKSYDSIISCSYAMDVYHSTIKKCLSGELKYAKLHQYSFEKVDKMQDLTEYSTGSSKEVLLLDTYDNEIIRFKSKVDCDRKLNLGVVGTSHKNLLGPLNKHYGNRYKMFYDGKWQQSTYYNTGIIIERESGEIETYLSKKELMQTYNIPKCYGTKEKFTEKLNEVFTEHYKIKYDLPQCDINHIRKSCELRERP